MASMAPRISIVSQAAAELVGHDLSELNQIVLHLGNGCSASAVRGGVAIETSMGLTPLQGLVMGTRSGDVDPGLHTFLHNELGMTVARDRHAVEQAVRPQRHGRCQRLPRAGAAAGVPATRRLSWRSRCTSIGSSTTSARTRSLLGRLDLLSFTAGVGENNPALRAAVVDGLEGLGFRGGSGAERRTFQGQARVISPDGAPITIAVVPTNEELAIARETAALLDARSD